MKYIDMDSFLQGRITIEALSPELCSNANTIVPKVNELLSHFGEYRACNSGYRSITDQQRINPKAMHSKHLICAAIDIEDQDGRLNKFCKDNPQILEDLGLFLEERQGGWQHFQCIAFNSYKPGHSRWFFP